MSKPLNKSMIPRKAEGTQTQENVRTPEKSDFGLDKLRQVDISQIIKSKAQIDEVFTTPMKDEEIQTNNGDTRTPEVRMGKYITNVMV